MLQENTWNESINNARRRYILTLYKVITTENILLVLARGCKNSNNKSNKAAKVPNKQLIKEKCFNLYHIFKTSLEQGIINRLSDLKLADFFPISLNTVYRSLLQ